MIKWIPQTDQREIAAFNPPDFPSYKDVAVYALQTSSNAALGTTYIGMTTLNVRAFKQLFILEAVIHCWATFQAGGRWVANVMAVSQFDIPEPGHPGIASTYIPYNPRLVCKSGEMNTVDIMRAVPADQDFGVIKGGFYFDAPAIAATICTFHVNIFYLLLN